MICAHDHKWLQEVDLGKDEILLFAYFDFKADFKEKEITSIQHSWHK